MSLPSDANGRFSHIYVGIYLDGTVTHTVMLCISSNLKVGERKLE